MAEVQTNGATDMQTAAPPPVPLTAEPTATVVPIKRGPGRPRKNPVDANAAAPVKRGPGRPRKNPVEASAAPVKRGPGRPRKNPVEASAAPVKRGPGRPRKNPVDAAHAAKRGPGRPKGSKRTAGVKAQTQIAKLAMKYYEQQAKEQGIKASALLREVLENYVTRRGVELAP